MMRGRGSVNLYDKEVGYLPELCRIGYPQDLLSVDIHYLIRILRLACHHLGLLAVGRDLGESALVGSLEIIHIEITLHDLGLAQEARRKDVTLLKFLAVAYGILTCVEFGSCLVSLSHGCILQLTLVGDICA